MGSQCAVNEVHQLSLIMRGGFCVTWLITHRKTKLGIRQCSHYNCFINTGPIQRGTWGGALRCIMRLPFILDVSNVNFVCTSGR